jgi:quercetin 2,3-dioxygenase
MTEPSYQDLKSKDMPVAEQTLKVLLYAGEPIGERVVARGPFVMTSEDEINEAIDDYYAGKFGDIK